MRTCMYHTGLDPRDMTPVYVPKTAHEKAMQRAQLQFRNPRNHDLVREALRLCNREDLIGFGPHALVPPEREATTYGNQRSAGGRGEPSRSNGKRSTGASRGAGSAPRSRRAETRSQQSPKAPARPGSSATGRDRRQQGSAARPGKSRRK
jgi:hypothetical protein